MDILNFKIDNKLTIVQGSSQSGKSTFCTKIINQNSENFEKIFLVCLKESSYVYEKFSNYEHIYFYLMDYKPKLNENNEYMSLSETTIQKNLENKIKEKLDEWENEKTLLILDY